MLPSVRELQVLLASLNQGWGRQYYTEESVVIAPNPRLSVALGPSSCKAATSHRWSGIPLGLLSQGEHCERTPKRGR